VRLTATKDAREVLEAVTEGLFAEVLLPVDPVRIAKELGIEVYTAVLDDGVSGMLLKRSNEEPEIYLNRHDHKNRQRFTCAHELGHYIKRTNEDDFDFAFVDRRDSLSSRGSDADEMYANQFAAELLMPEKQVRAHHKTSELTQLAWKFSVSTEAMSNRLKTLRLA